jgi:hypothetical protein
MPSLRDLSGCIGVSGNFSVLRDFYGFFRGVLPPDPTGAQVQVSLKRQIQRLQDDYYDINVIAIGVDMFTDADDQSVDYAIYKIRNIYNQVSVGIGRVRHYGVDTADADGLDSPTSEDDLEDITSHWTVDNDALDVFIPFNMNVPSNGGSILGLSAVDGSCDKDSKGMTGSVTGLWASEQIARTFAHEVGHYLGLSHRNSDTDNLMCQSKFASSTRDSVELTSGQGSDIKDHCFMNDGC